MRQYPSFPLSELPEPADTLIRPLLARREFKSLARLARVNKVWHAAIQPMLTLCQLFPNTMSELASDPNCIILPTNEAALIKQLKALPNTNNIQKIEADFDAFIRPDPPASDEKWQAARVNFLASLLSQEQPFLTVSLALEYFWPDDKSAQEAAIREAGLNTLTYKVESMESFFLLLVHLEIARNKLQLLTALNSLLCTLLIRRDPQFYPIFQSLPNTIKTDVLLLKHSGSTLFESVLNANLYFIAHEALCALAPGERYTLLLSTENRPHTLFYYLVEAFRTHASERKKESDILICMEGMSRYQIVILFSALTRECLQEGWKSSTGSIKFKAQFLQGVCDRLAKHYLLSPIATLHQLACTLTSTNALRQCCGMIERALPDIFKTIANEWFSSFINTLKAGLNAGEDYRPHVQALILRLKSLETLHSALVKYLSVSDLAVASHDKGIPQKKRNLLARLIHILDDQTISSDLFFRVMPGYDFLEDKRETEFLSYERDPRSASALWKPVIGRPRGFCLDWKLLREALLIAKLPENMSATKRDNVLAILDQPVARNARQARQLSEESRCLFEARNPSFFQQPGTLPDDTTPAAQVSAAQAQHQASVFRLGPV